jgi:AraC-like DNA-binding protein
VSEQALTGRDRLRELLDAVVDAANTDVESMARSSHFSEFHFSREVRRLAGEPPAAMRRRVMLERAAWRLQRGESVSAVAAAEGWSSAEVFSRAFRRAFGVPPSRAAEVHYLLPAPNGVHFHPPHALWVDGPGSRGAPAGSVPEISAVLVDHDVADTDYLLECACTLTDRQWAEEISPGQQVLAWDGPEPSVGAVLGAIVWTKQVWLATIEEADFPTRQHLPPSALRDHHRDVGARWIEMVQSCSAAGKLGDTVIDALCDPPESFPLYGIIAHVLTFSALRRGLARAMLAHHGVRTHHGDPLAWMRSN